VGLGIESKIIIAARYGERFIEIRKEFFPAGECPASALITVAGFARPGMMIEIHCAAALADQATTLACGPLVFFAFACAALACMAA